MHIATVEKLPLSTTGSPLMIRCKTFLNVTFVISKERECHDVYMTLLKLCQPGEFTQVFFDVPKLSLIDDLCLKCTSKICIASTIRPATRSCLKHRAGSTLRLTRNTNGCECPMSSGQRALWIKITNFATLTPGNCLYLPRWTQLYWWEALASDRKVDCQSLLIYTQIRFVGWPLGV